MHLKTRNVNTAFHELVKVFDDGANERTETFFRGINPVVKRTSRNGNVLVIDEPVTITYTHPRERVLFNQSRDANPMFHLYEALWMLAGRNDVDSVAMYAKQMREYSDDGKTLNGAYGYRWRHANYGCGYDHYHNPKECDQLDILINHLKAQPNSRRAVLQMWNVEDDLLKIGQTCSNCEGTGELTEPVGPCPDCGGRFESREDHTDKGWSPGSGKVGVSRDVCCNLSVMFSLRACFACDARAVVPESCQVCHGKCRSLDMTVTNRSNDLIWGLLGANYVHFTFLQEYVACALGAEVGVYHHFTNNLHAYDWNWKPEEWLVEPVRPHEPPGLPLFTLQNVFDRELPLFVEWFAHPYRYGREWECDWLRSVAQPALLAFSSHKTGHTDLALEQAHNIVSPSWRVACVQWLARRQAKKEAKI